MKRTNEWYEVRSLDDMHGLAIHADSEEQALAEINEAYFYAKKQGYDNRHEKWLIVCNKLVKEFDEQGQFLKEEKVRFVVGNAQFSSYENEFVLAY